MGAVKNKAERFWEIDFLRGLAVAMMVLFHLLFDLDYFGASEASAEVSEPPARVDFGVHARNLDSGFWLYFARATAAIFVFLAGVSLAVSYWRARKKMTPLELRLKFVGRGVRIFLWGMLITLATLVFLKEGFIFFGVLHLVGVSIILAYPLVRYRFTNLVLGVILIAAGIYVQGINASSYWLLWLGLAPAGFYTLDYFPLLPWFGVILIGLFFGNTFYPNAQRKFRLPDLSQFSIVRLIRVAGSNSLLIYFLHQPALVILLYLSGQIDGRFLAGFLQ